MAWTYSLPQTDISLTWILYPDRTTSHFHPLLPQDMRRLEELMSSGHYLHAAGHSPSTEVRHKYFFVWQSICTMQTTLTPHLLVRKASLLSSLYHLVGRSFVWFKLLRTFCFSGNNNNSNICSLKYQHHDFSCISLLGTLFGNKGFF